MNRPPSIIDLFASMRLAVTLLVMLAIASVIGTLVKQGEPFQNYVVKFGPFWAEVFERLGIFNLYSTGWFVALLLLIAFSLTLCLIRQASSGQRMMNARRWGYFLLHGGILIILAGVFIDTHPLLRFKLLSGQIQPVPFDQMPDQAPDEAWLPANEGAFQAPLRLSPREKTDHVFLTGKQGYLIQKLPFTIALERFEIQYYDNGMPSGYVSHIALLDDQGQLIKRQPVSVNRPLSHAGHTLYQSTYDDGGSLMTFMARRPGTRQAIRKTMQVGESIQVRLGNQNLRLTITDFHLHTVIQKRGGRTLNRGPRMTYSLMDETGRRTHYESYMSPQRSDGLSYAWLAMKADAWPIQRILAIPLLKGGTDAFWQGWNRLMSRQEDSLEARLIQLFVHGGFNAVTQFVEQNFEQKQHEPIKKFYNSILLKQLHTVFSSLKDADARWVGEAIIAADAVATYRPELWLELTDFEQRLSSGLIVARRPGQPLVWTGALLLVIGIFLMLYTKRR